VLLERLQAAFERAGGAVVPDAAARLIVEEGRVQGVALMSGARLSGGAVVLAAGCQSQALLDGIPQVATRIPRLLSGVGVSALLRGDKLPAPPHVIRTPNRAFACGLHMVPRRPGEVYIGATNMIALDPYEAPPLRDLTFLLECATRQLRKDLWDCRVHCVQTGNRPVSADGFPLLGPAGMDGLWLMTGTYRDGVHMSPLLAAEMGRRLVSEKPELDLAAFTPVRAPLQSASRAEIIESAITHMIATGDEANWDVTNDWPKFIERSLRLAYEKFAAELDEQYTPPPEIFAQARVNGPLARMLKEYYAATRAAERR
jgi:glycine/D-amino acid oxidase-like deaminating enzyme